MDILLIKVMASFIVSGIWIAAATLIAEKFGSKVGGLIVNLPSNIAVSLLFVALVQSPQFAASATLSVPLGMAITTIFMISFILTVKRGLAKSLIFSIGIWFVFALLLKFFKINYISSLAIYLIVMLVSFYLAEHLAKVRSVEKKNISYTKSQIFTRVLIAGSIVSATVFASSFLSPFWIGIMSSFPAVTISSFLILTMNQGPEFAQSTGKIMILSSVNIIVYAAAVFLTYPTLGIVYGTLISLLASYTSVLLLSPLIKHVR